MGDVGDSNGDLLLSDDFERVLGAIRLMKGRWSDKRELEWGGWRAGGRKELRWVYLWIEGETDEFSESELALHLSIDVHQPLPCPTVESH